MLVITFCKHGSLLDLLGHTRDGISGFDSFGRLRRIAMSTDIACGMHHLGTHRIVHRDLSARNVLVDATLACKVADFGLARTVESTSKSSS